MPIENASMIPTTSSTSSSGKPASTSPDILPKVSNAHIERAGTQRWLVVEGTPDSLWPTVKAFWQELGFLVNVEIPEAGVMETDWAENRAKIDDGAIRNTFGKLLATRRRPLTNGRAESPAVVG